MSLYNYKNYDSCDLDLVPQLNCFVGLNGAGKTNVLDAIHCLAIGKSAWQQQDAMLLKANAPYFLVRGLAKVKEEDFDISFSLKTGERKQLKVNKETYARMSDHVGRFPVVLITPDDTVIVREGSELRRRFFDGVIAQKDRAYLENLISYTRALKQRNALLKKMAEQGSKRSDWLEPYDEQLLKFGRLLAEKRKSFLEEFAPLFKDNFSEITAGRDEVNIDYTTQVLTDDFAGLFKKSHQKDLLMQRTTMGTHRDDYEFTLDEQPLKKFGSQGQQKSFVIALKLAQFKILTNKESGKPLLLLDDIFDKLDDERIDQLLKMMESGNFGQIFLTDARASRLKELLKGSQMKVKVFKISEGKLLGEERINV